jgi:TolB-like protein/Tfp pilus assembly protein PilF
MIYLFEQFAIDTGQYQLSLEGNPVPVEPLVFDLLVYLIENCERVVGRDELLENLWKGKVVTDAALAARLKDARKALGDSGDRQEFIKTVHGRGYQFIAPIVESGKADPMQTVEKIMTGRNLELPAKPSIAVLPLQNESEGIEADYFSNGVTDGIINGLTRFRDLFVMGRSSSFSFKDKAVDIPEIGRRLGVRYVVQGVVRKLGERVRVSVELVDAETGQNLWSEHYDRELKDVFAVEDEVTQAIVATLVTQVEDAAYHHSKIRASENLEAYEWLLQGNRFVDRGGKEDLFEARRMYQQALALDPDFSAAYTGLSKTYMYEHWGHLAEDYDKAINRSIEFGQKAVELDDKDSRAHYAVGHAYFCSGQHARAEFHIEKALALNPGEYDNLCFKGYLLACTGRHEESRSCLSDSMRHNPLAPNSCLCALGMSDYLAGRYEEATVILTKLASDPPRKYGCLAASYAQLGRNDEAHRAAAEFRDLMEPDLASELDDDNSKWRDYWARVFSIFTPADLEHLFEGLRKAGFPG